MGIISIGFHKRVRAFENKSGNFESERAGGKFCELSMLVQDWVSDISQTENRHGGSRNEGHAVRSTLGPINCATEFAARHLVGQLTWICTACDPLRRSGPRDARKASYQAKRTDVITFYKNSDLPTKLAR